jgi:Glycosyltransferase
MRYGVLNPDNQGSKSVSGNLRFGYIGSLQPSKGVDVLVEAFNKIGDDSGTKLTIYGELVESGFFSGYCQLLRKKATCKSINFAGKFSRENLSKIFNEIDVLIVPSVWYENCPNVILEAMSFKIPVIASSIGGMTELIEDGKTGLCLNPAILKIY